MDMQAIYTVIFLLAVLVTLPVSSRKVAYAWSRREGPDYDALRNVPRKSRAAVRIAFLVIFIMMVILCVNKSENMADYAMYEYLYRLDGSRTVHKETEVTFGIIAGMSPSFLWLLGIYAVISCGLHLYGILRNSSSLLLSVLVYFGLFFVLHDMIQIRAAVVSAILLLSVRYIAERRWEIYFPLAMIAVLFHNSAIIMIPLYFIPYKRLNRYVWCGILLVSLILGLAGVQFGSAVGRLSLGMVNSYMESYMGNRMFKAAAIGPVRIMECLMLMVLIWNLKKIKRHYPYAVPCAVLSVFSEMCYLLLGDIPVLQGRMGELLGIVNILTYAMFPLMSKKHYYVLMIIPAFIGLYQLGNVSYLLQGIEQ